MTSELLIVSIPVELAAVAVLPGEGAGTAVDATAYLAGRGDHTAPLIELLTGHRHVQIPAGWLDLPCHSADLPKRIQPGDRLWVAAGCFQNEISGNIIDNAGMTSGTWWRARSAGIRRSRSSGPEGREENEVARLTNEK